MAVIKLENFKKSFGTKVVHSDVSFEVNKGECLGLVGGSGVGKSVILKSLIGLIKPDQGNIFIDDENISSMRENELIDIRKKVAYVFQNGALFDSMTVFDNLAYPLREHTDFSSIQIKKMIHDLLEEFNLDHNEMLYPAELSGGMQKRVGLARSIILQPKVVLYDEPTAGLDPFNTIKIQEMIIKLKSKGVTSIFVTHDMPSAFACCDRLVLAKDGIIACSESMENIKKSTESPIHDFVKGVA